MGSLKMNRTGEELFRRFESHFDRDAKQLQRSIIKEKHKKKEKQIICCDQPSHKCIVPAFRAHKHSCKVDSHQKNCSVESQWMNCKCSKSPNSLNKNSPLFKTKGIKMTQKRYQEVVNGWKKQNRELEAEIETYRNQKETNKETLALKCDEIFCIKNQNSKLEELLKKCENRIGQLVKTENARNANKIMANNLDTQLFCYQAHLKDLEIKLDSLHADLYTAKAERNRLMMETFNLRRDNKNLECQIKEIREEKDEAEEEFTRLQFLLRDMRKEDGKCCLDNNDQYLDDVLDDIELHEVPSAITALNHLKSNHQTEYKKLKIEIDQMKSKVGADQKEIKNL